MTKITLLNWSKYFYLFIYFSEEKGCSKGAGIFLFPSISTVVELSWTVSSHLILRVEISAILENIAMVDKLIEDFQFYATMLPSVHQTKAHGSPDLRASTEVEQTMGLKDFGTLW